MSSELTNLLPSQRRRASAREYRFRLGVVALMLLVALTSVAAVLLVPTYIFLAGSAGAKSARLKGLQSALSSSDEKVLSARLKALSDDTAALIALSDKPTASSILRAALAVDRPDVTLSGFTYAPATTKGTSGTLSLSGTAATRDALRSYQLALQSAPFVRSADLPVSVYAKDTDITFTITITLAP